MTQVPMNSPKGSEKPPDESDDDVSSNYTFTSLQCEDVPPSLPGDSVPASASELLLSDLSKKTKLLRIAQKEAHRYKLRCEALASQLNLAKSARESQSPPTRLPRSKPTRMLPHLKSLHLIIGTNSQIALLSLRMEAVAHPTMMTSPCQHSCPKRSRPRAQK